MLNNPTWEISQKFLSLTKSLNICEYFLNKLSFWFNEIIERPEKFADKISRFTEITEPPWEISQQFFGI